MNKLEELLFLKNIKGIGKAKINKYLDLISKSKNTTELIENIKNTYPKEHNKYFTEDQINNAKSSTKDLINQLESLDIKAITIFDNKYPKQLNKMEKDKPLILYVLGNVDLLNRKSIAVVGTRKPSKTSKFFESKLVKSILKTSNRVIVSGLALGCDKIAHKTTVNEKKETIAILPSGFNNIVPASNKGLAKEILENNGCLISEYEPDVKVFKSKYIERDKIVAAFCDITIVIESAINGGTMHTAKAALKYKKDLYAYLPDKTKENEFEGNKSLINNTKATKLNDIELFCEGITIIDSDNKKDKQTNLDCF